MTILMCAQKLTDASLIYRFFFFFFFFFFRFSARRQVLCTIVDPSKAFLTNSSAYKLKRSAESGHPCLFPLLIMHGSEYSPSILTRALWFIYSMQYHDQTNKHTHRWTDTVAIHHILCYALRCLATTRPFVRCVVMFVLQDL